MKHFPLLLLALGLAQTAFAQDDKLVLSGSIQSDVLIPESDSVIGATTDGDWAKTCTYVDLQAQSRHVDAGLRLEYLEHPLPGYEAAMRGWGVPHVYLKGKTRAMELTIGSYYEQFGSGLILRTYEERSLGIDNSLMGVRAVVRPMAGLQVKALYGVQRTYWSWTESTVGGADAEVAVDELLPALQKSGTRLLLGASWVNKEEAPEDIFVDATHKLNLPRFVNAWDLRANLHHKGWGLLAEYARKTDDPSFDNGYTYHNGSAAMLSGSYSQRGLSVLVQMKRSEDMSFRSERSRLGTAGTLNFLPAFTLDHTYALAAQYPYATQLAGGEWAYQAELGYNFKRKTRLGGKYGMDLKLNYSYVRGLDHDAPTYYQDLDVQLSRKFSKAFRLSVMYMNQRIDESVVRGEGDMMHNDIFVAEGKYQFSPKITLRAEAQYLTTRQDRGDWAFGLLELSLVPHWMLTLSDKWNCGKTDVHYYQGLVTFNTGAHRIQAGYGRTDDGYNCSGGVCRYVPSSRGFTLSYNYNF